MFSSGLKQTKILNLKMKKKIIFFFVSLILLSAGFLNVARAEEMPIPDEEAILNFHSDIIVNTDNSINVAETIIYNTGARDRHGIYRDIYPYSSTGDKMKISNVTVTDENGAPHIFETYNEGKNFRIKIGDPEKTFVGEKIYKIKYNANRAVAQFEKFDEIYWNVTGNDWEIPIYEAGVSINLPEGVKATQTSCYYGLRGSTNECYSKNNEADKYFFYAPNILESEEGLTVAVGFPKGIVVPYSNADKFSSFFAKYLPRIIGIFLPIFTLVFSLLYWKKKWKDPKGKGVIVPQYDVPDALTPMEVAGIASEKLSVKDISGELIYLATKGYLKINQIEERTLGIFKSTDYELLKLKDFTDLLNEFDKKLLSGLFGSGSSVKLSELKNVFYTTANAVVTSALDALLTKGYYKNLGRMKNSAGVIFIIIFMSVWASLLFGGFIGVLFFNGDVFPIIIGIFISIIIYGIILRFSPAKTEKGVATMEYLLGLKDYLRIAEKDRLEFHNAPDKKPETFEKLLPYAMVLGVAGIWAKEFESIYTTPPSWYVGSSNNAFNAVVFSNSLSNFSAYASSSLSSSPSNSGSGGGGSSGGGGGGGGGGGW